MGSLFKPKKQDVTTTTSNTSTRTPGAQAQPLVDEASKQFLAALQGGAFGGLSVGPQSGLTQQGLSSIDQLAGSGSPLSAAAQQATLSNLGFSNPFTQQFQGAVDTALGAGIGGLTSQAQAQVNPYAQQQFDAAAAPVTQAFQNATGGLSSKFSELGRLRGGGASVGNAFSQQQENLGRTLANLGSNIFAPAFENQANRSLQASSQLSNLGLSALGGGGNQALSDAAFTQQAAGQAAPVRQGAFGDALQLLQGGQIDQSYLDRLAAATRQQHLEPFNFAQSGLSAATQLGSAFGTTQGSGSQTTPTFGPSLGSQVLGAGLGLAGLAFSPIPAGGTTAIGSLLG